MVKDLDSFWAWVDSRMIEVGISSYRDLARRAGVSHGTINQAKNSLKVPTVEIAEGLCRALRVDWVELWSRAGFVDRLNVDRTALTLSLCPL
jgi:transcriptional regulator with XRE-family HTH domain